MKTILIPVDLIGETENAINYAADFSCEMHVEQIILLKSYYVSVVEEVLPTPDFVQLSADEIENTRESLESSLQALGAKVQKGCAHHTRVETVFSSLPMLRAVHNVILEKQASLVLLGSDPNTREPGSYLGEQIIAIAKTSPVPVMVIPEAAKYKKIEEVLVPVDFSAISRLSAIQGFHSRQNWARPHLVILNVNPKQQHTAGETQVAQNLAETLEGYTYDVHHSADKETVDGILSFARHHRVQMIVALPGKYSFFYNLTHKSITHAIALNATRPVLILK